MDMEMKKLVLLVLGLLIFPSQIQAEEYRIYKSGKPVVSRYVVRSRPDGSYSVYDSRQIVVPKYAIQPNLQEMATRSIRQGSLLFLYMRSNKKVRAVVADRRLMQNIRLLYLRLPA